ncbi:MAG: TusE/DsrC/DsvC family sulfur relay protein [Arcticibacterium sp.]|jgi:TusE/DsrC/DsvC family sulfur relay protein
MSEKTIAGYCINCNDQGYLTDHEQWNREIGLEIAGEEEINMTDKHWEVIEYLRDQCKQEVAITIRKVGKSGVVDIKGFYQLFPKGPLKTASKIAGIPKPVSCI